MNRLIFLFLWKCCAKWVCELIFLSITKYIITHVSIIWSDLECKHLLQFDNTSICYVLQILNDYCTFGHDISKYEMSLLPLIYIFDV